MEKSKRTIAKGPLLVLGGVLLFIALWYLVTWILREYHGNRILPYPHDVLVSLCQMLFGDLAFRTYRAAGWSLARVLIGFSVSFVLAGLLGTLAALYPGVKSFLSFFVAVAKVFPAAATVLILTCVFFSIQWDTGYLPCILSFLIVFPIVYEAFVKGIGEISSDIRDAMALDVGERSPKGVIYISWPMIAPYIGLSVSQSLGLSLKVTIMSEIMVSSSDHYGLGMEIYLYRLNMDMEDLIAVSLVAVFLILIIDGVTWFIRNRLGVEHKPWFHVGAK